MRFHVQEYERCARCIMPACSRAAGHHIDQTFAIIDVKGEAQLSMPAGSLSGHCHILPAGTSAEGLEVSCW